jgi:hypothetical protein
MNVKFIKKEKTFKNQQELQEYLIHGFAKVKRLRFNLKSISVKTGI